MISEIVERNRSYIIEQTNNGKGSQFISKQIGCSKTAIRNFLKRNNIKSKCKARDDNNLVQDKLTDILKLYDCGHTLKDIGRIVGNSRVSVSRVLKKNGYEIQDRRYNIDETFFDNIDTEEKAYMYGFILADGTVSFNGRLKISIRDYDGYILEGFVKALKYSGPLLDGVGHKVFYPNNKMKTLCIYRKRLVDQLIEKGCVPAKTWSLRFPSPEVISDEMLPHFIRSMMDGDGCYYVTKQKRVNASLSSTKWFIDGFVKRISNIGITGFHIRDTSNDLIKEVRLNRQNELKILYNFLYQDASLFLLRKKEKFEQCL